MSRDIDATANRTVLTATVINASGNHTAVAKLHHFAQVKNRNMWKIKAYLASFGNFYSSTFPSLAGERREPARWSLSDLRPA
jgi:hypothetical protein